MQDISRLKQDLDFIGSLGSIVDTLKSAALIQFQVFQKKKKINRLFFKEIENCFALLLTKKIDSPYLLENSELPQAIILITSDEGFLGELNSLILNTGFQKRRSKKDKIIVLGERGARHLEEAGETFVSFPGISDSVRPQETEALIEYLLEGYNKEFNHIMVVYPEFVSLTVQRVIVFDLLPYAIPSEEDEFRLNQVFSREIIIEPSQKEVIASLIELWMGFRFLEIFWTSKHSEYAARIMHLEGSTHELGLLTRKTRLAYFKQVHALSDKTIREISATKMFLKGKN